MRNVLFSLLLAWGAVQGGELEDHYRELGLLQAISPDVTRVVIAYNAHLAETCGRIAGSPKVAANSETFVLLLAAHTISPAKFAEKLKAAPCPVELPSQKDGS